MPDEAVAYICIPNDHRYHLPEDPDTLGIKEILKKWIHEFRNFRQESESLFIGVNDRTLVPIDQWGVFICLDVFFEKR